MNGISTEQLRSRLNRMVADGLLTRQRYREVPPRVDYDLTPRARAAFPLIGAAARWALQYTWATPRAGEEVNVAELFGLAPMLVAGGPRRQRDIRIALVVRDEDRGPQTATVTLPRGAGGMAEVSHELPEGALDVVVSGTVSGWVAAFAPEGTIAPLTVEGENSLALHVVEQLAGRV